MQMIHSLETKKRDNDSILPWFRFDCVMVPEDVRWSNLASKRECRNAVVHCASRRDGVTVAAAAVVDGDYYDAVADFDVVFDLKGAAYSDDASGCAVAVAKI